MRPNVNEGKHALAVSHQQQGFIAKGGKGGKCAKDTDKEKEPRLRIEEIAQLHELRQKADEQTAQQVNREGAHRKSGAPCPSLDPSAKQISKNGANKTAHSNEHDVNHRIKIPYS